MLEHLSIGDYSCLCCLSTGKHAWLAQNLQQRSDLRTESGPYSIKLESAEVLTVRWYVEVTTFHAQQLAKLLSSCAWCRSYELPTEIRICGPYERQSSEGVL